jgi:hypothetical protein
MTNREKQNQGFDNVIAITEAAEKYLAVSF